MQKWEYAYIRYREQQWVALYYLHSTGVKKEVIQSKGGLFSKTPDYDEEVRVLVTRLGQEGYEMIFANVSPISLMPAAPSSFVDYWFKRPAQ